MDKENERHTHKSKIPLPLDPLPPLPEKILNNYRDAKEERHPLQTLYNESKNKECAAGTSTLQERYKPAKRKTKTINVIDTQYVTVRKNNDNLDWGYTVFNEELQQRSTEDQSNNCVRGTCRAITPVPQSPLKQNSRIRNIKKSLKRPHSRELQGISPIPSIKKGEEKHKRKLYFTQPLQSQSQPPNFWKKSYTANIEIDYAQDIFTYLLSKEAVSMLPRISTDPRACIMNWLLKVNGPEGNPAVIQTARWYFDTVLTVGGVALNKMQVVATACFWLSMKIHGHSGTAKKMAFISSNAFSVATLLAAERAVLRKLKFPAQPVTSQEFIMYLSWHCDEARSSEIELIATIMCMAGFLVSKVFCAEYPSVVGAAAVTNATYLLKKARYWSKLKNNSIYKEIEKKTSRMTYICALQRHAIRKMAASSYGYNVLLEHFGNYPYCMSQKIVSFANDCASTDQKTWLL